MRPSMPAVAVLTCVGVTLAAPAAHAFPGGASDQASTEECGNTIDCGVALDFADDYCHQRDRGYTPQVSRTIVRQVSTGVGYSYHLADDVATAAPLICSQYAE